MTIQGVAVGMLLGFSNLLGVTPIATDHGTWSVLESWNEVDPQQDQSALRFRAETTALVEQCQRAPDSHIIFPAVVHGAHQLILDGRVISTFGDPSFARTRSFYGQPALTCREVQGGKKLEWIAYSYTRYFARVSFFPYVSVQPSFYNVFAETWHIIGAGVGLIMAILTFTMFAGKISRETTLAVCSASFFSSVYLGNCVAGYLGIPWSMLTAHKIADIGVWLSVCLLLKALYHEGIITKKYFQFHLSTIAIAIVIILLGHTGDIVQFGTTIPFAVTLVVMFVLLARLSHQMAIGERTPVQWMQFFSLGSFAAASLNEMFVVSGLVHTSPMLPFGFMGAVFFLALAVNVRVNAMYLERDYLRDNLENEVKLQTAKLEKAMVDLRLTQAELVQSAKLASLGTLSAGIAHEINNSLNYVNGALQPLERLIAKSVNGEQSDKINKLVNIMKDGLNLTFEIIKGLRTYTGLNQAKQNDVEILSVVNSSITILRSRINGQIKVECQIPADLKVFGMVVGLNQIFMNLITNALDAMKDGGTLTIRGQQNGESVELSVSDTGNGMPQSVIDRIFEPFFTTKDVGHGTGLGLHIVRQEIERHQGKIRVESEHGAGTTFFITLPTHAILPSTGAAA